MPDYVYGSSFGDVSQQELQRRALGDQRFFQSLAANREAQAMEERARQSDINNLLAVVNLAQEKQRQQAVMEEARRRTATQAALDMFGQQQANVRATGGEAGAMQRAILGERGDTLRELLRTQRMRSDDALKQAFNLFELGTEPAKVEATLGQDLGDMGLNIFRTGAQAAAKQEAANLQQIFNVIGAANQELQRLDDFEVKLTSLVGAHPDLGSEFQTAAQDLYKRSGVQVNLPSAYNNLPSVYLPLVIEQLQKHRAAIHKTVSPYAIGQDVELPTGSVSIRYTPNVRPKYFENQNLRFSGSSQPALPPQLVPPPASRTGGTSAPPVRPVMQPTERQRELARLAAEAERSGMSRNQAIAAAVAALNLKTNAPPTR